MSHPMLNASDRKLLSFILGLHAESGPIERAQLSVKARGIGIEVARALLNLKKHGLVEEITQRPGALRRLFGAKTLVMVGPTETGLAEGAASDGGAGVTAEARSAPDRAKAAEAVPAAAPVAPPATPVARVAAPAPAAPRESRQALRARLDAFTEDLGGTPIEEDLTRGAPQVAADVMDGLRETLALHDMELTAAGETLIADRMAKGASQGEALCQVVLYAFAHAVHLAATGGCAFRPGALKDYAVGVMRALEALRDGGEIRDDRFEEDMHRLWALVGGEADAAETAEDLLSDPIGGMAPAAVLSEEVLQSEDVEAWPL